MIIVAFAVPHEGELLARQVACSKPLSGGLKGIEGTLLGHRVAILHVGMGKAAAKATMQKALDLLKPIRVIMAGYAGALTHQWDVGDIVVAQNFSTPEWFEKIPASGTWRSAVFYCSDVILATPEARESVYQKYQAHIVEMETEPVYKLCKAQGVPILAVRVVSDTVDDVLPTGALEIAFVPVVTPWMVIRLLFYLLRHREEVKPFIRFVSQVHTARVALTQFLQGILQKHIPMD
jgi:adenosylhomocysteine nucleosidase